MKTRYLIGFFVLLMVAGLALVLNYGLQPRPIQKIRISEFASEAVAGQALSTRLNLELKQNLVVLMGLDRDVPFQQEVIRQAIASSQKDGWEFSSILVDERLGIDFKDQKYKVLNFKNDFELLVSGLSKAKEANARVLLISPNIDVSQRLTGNFFAELSARITIPMTSIVFSNFPRTREQEQGLRISCNTGNEDNQGAAQLGCLVLQTSRANYRKKMKSGAWVGLLNQIGKFEYLFLFAQEP